MPSTARAVSIGAPAPTAAWASQRWTAGPQAFVVPGDEDLGGAPRLGRRLPRDRPARPGRDNVADPTVDPAGVGDKRDHVPPRTGSDGGVGTLPGRGGQRRAVRLDVLDMV